MTRMRYKVYHLMCNKNVGKIYILNESRIVSEFVASKTMAKWIVTDVANQTLYVEVS